MLLVNVCTIGYASHETISDEGLLVKEWKLFYGRMM